MAKQQKSKSGARPAATKATGESAKLSDLVAVLGAIGASQAMIEFETDGTIITANENFLAALGYEL